MGEKWLEIKPSPRIFRTLFFMSHFSPISVFQTTKNYKFSLYLILTLFSNWVLETHLGVLMAACIGPAVSQFFNAGKKTESKKFLDSVFYEPFLPHFCFSDH